MYGFTRNYIKVEFPFEKSLIGKIVDVRMIGISADSNMQVEVI